MRRHSECTVMMGAECSCGYTSERCIPWGINLSRMSYWLCSHSKILAETLEFFPDSKIRCMLIVAPLLPITDADLNITQRLQAKFSRPGYRTLLLYEKRLVSKQPQFSIILPLKLFVGSWYIYDDLRSSTITRINYLARLDGNLKIR